MAAGLPAGAAAGLAAGLAAGAAAGLAAGLAAGGVVGFSAGVGSGVFAGGLGGEQALNTRRPTAAATIRLRRTNRAQRDGIDWSIDDDTTLYPPHLSVATSRHGAPSAARGEIVKVPGEYYMIRGALVLT